MIYEFFCKPCNAIDEVVRPVSEAKEPYLCPECGGETVRRYTAPQVVTSGEDIAEFNPAFGKVMTRAQAQAEAKSRGWTEVGNEDVHKGVGDPKQHDYEFNDYLV